MIEVRIINKFEKDGIWAVTFKYWVAGDCACGAIRKVSTFYHNPSMDEIKKSI